MPDGSVKHVHVVLQNIGQHLGHPEFVGAVTDITERKRAEAELRQAYERLQRAGAELSHVSRVTTVSALTASIAHEVNQPLAGIITNAGTCLRMLDAVPPNIEGARETARRTIRDGNRASDVIRAAACAVQQAGDHTRAAGSERSRARSDCAVGERPSEKPHHSSVGARR
jgi:signal transduction histidine kinase